MKLTLARPIVFFDLETTGTHVVHDRIVQIAMLKIFPEGDRLTFEERLNPTVPIPAAATAVHGICDRDVAGLPTFADLAAAVFDFIGDSDLAGYNILRFDIPLLVEEFARLGISFRMQNRKVVDAYQVFRRREPRTLTKAMEFYCRKPLPDAHDAMADVNATVDVLEGQLAYYDDLSGAADDLHRQFTPYRFQEYLDVEGKLRWEHNEVVFGFGVHKGETLRSVVGFDREYCDWMLASDFSLTVKGILRSALQGRYPERGAD